ncbi:TlpA family protein disulfide reductase [Candidatus Pelagibacter bacterium]|nr:TlpA family protein disulfide reductase [Candidatus Pelagibacter bacterium]
MKFLIIFIYLITASFSYAIEKPSIKNLVLIEKPKNYEGVVFKDKNQKNVELANYKGKLVLLNFWATWCAPCKEEMPSLDSLQSENRLNNLKIFPINIGQEDLSKSEIFFKDLNIQNLDIYYDSTITLAKKFTLRGVPTTIIFNKEGYEFARIIGSINFNDEDFINWLKRYN